MKECKFDKDVECNEKCVHHKTCIHSVEKERCEDGEKRDAEEIDTILP